MESYGIKGGLVPLRKVQVSPYNEQWSFMYAEEVNKIEQILGTDIVRSHHIGSTSVPGLKAKPIIDIMIVVRDIAIADTCNQEMSAIGYLPKGENGIPGRRYFQKGGDERTHHVHVYQDENDEINRHLAFRDYLREHPYAREEYGNLKERLALEFPYDSASYIDGKDRFVKALEAKAVEWYGQRNKDKF
jgi:GrpB-like predicted nucleotidyltransferase (UPF0157 family)